MGRPWLGHHGRDCGEGFGMVPGRVGPGYIAPRLQGHAGNRSCLWPGHRAAAGGEFVARPSTGWRRGTACRRQEVQAMKPLRFVRLRTRSEGGVPLHVPRWKPAVRVAGDHGGVAAD